MKGKFDFDTGAALCLGICLGYILRSEPVFLIYTALWLCAAFAFYRGSKWGNRLACILFGLQVVMSIALVVLFGLSLVRMFGILFCLLGAVQYGANWNMGRDVLVYMPSLAYLLLDKECRKGTPLTEREVIAICAGATGLYVPADVAKAHERKRGYRDIDPDACWRDWQRRRSDLPVPLPESPDT